METTLDYGVLHPVIACMLTLLTPNKKFLLIHVSIVLWPLHPYYLYMGITFTFCNIFTIITPLRVCRESLNQPPQLVLPSVYPPHLPQGLLSNITESNFLFLRKVSPPFFQGAIYMNAYPWYCHYLYMPFGDGSVTENDMMPFFPCTFPLYTIIFFCCVSSNKFYVSCLPNQKNFLENLSHIYVWEIG